MAKGLYRRGRCCEALWLRWNLNREIHRRGLVGQFDHASCGCRVAIWSQWSRTEWTTGYAPIDGLALKGYAEENASLHLIFLGIPRGNLFDVLSAELSASDQVDFDCDKTTH